MKNIIEVLKKKGMEVLCWQGIRNSDTQKINQGYLFIKFHANTVLYYVQPESQNREYKAGQQIGFPIYKVSTRQEAIDKFRVMYLVVEPEPVQ